MDNNIFTKLEKALNNRIACEGQIIPCSPKSGFIKKARRFMCLFVAGMFVGNVYSFLIHRTSGYRAHAIITGLALIIAILSYLFDPDYDALLCVECQQNDKSVNIPKGTTLISAKGHQLVTLEATKHSLRDRFKHRFRKKALPEIYVIPIKFLNN